LSKITGVGVAKLDSLGTGGQIVVQALAGGTVSAATGGSFANGAVSAALQFTFNQLLDPREGWAHACLTGGAMFCPPVGTTFGYAEEYEGKVSLIKNVAMGTALYTGALVTRGATFSKKFNQSIAKNWIKHPQLMRIVPPLYGKFVLVRAGWAPKLLTQGTTAARGGWVFGINLGKGFGTSVIQYGPAGGRHKNQYWKVSSGLGKTHVPIWRSGDVPKSK